MTNKIQSMLTIALTAAVLALLVDRVIEPAQAQNCASEFDVAMEADEAANEAAKRVLRCIDGSEFDGSIYDSFGDKRFRGSLSVACY